MSIQLTPGAAAALEALNAANDLMMNGQILHVDAMRAYLLQVVACALSERWTKEQLLRVVDETWVEIFGAVGAVEVAAIQGFGRGDPS